MPALCVLRDAAVQDVLRGWRWQVRGLCARGVAVVVQFGQTPCKWCQHAEFTGSPETPARCDITHTHVTPQEFERGVKCLNWKVRTKKP